MKRYPHYKDSGVAWLGEVPQHWEVKRLKFAVELINRKTDVEDNALPYIGLEHIESWTGKKLSGEIADSGGIASEYQAGDVLFGKLRPYLAKVYLAEGAGLVSSEALVMRAQKELHNRFLKYFVLSKDFIDMVDSSTFGSKMPRANWEFIGNLPLTLPLISEQQSIAAWLDKKTTQIDTLIRRKQTLLEKLAEKRGALISHAVTKELNPAAAMKDSGVTWLGDVPQHWEVKRLKFAVTLINRKMEAEDSALSYIGLEHIESWTGKKLSGEIADSGGVASEYQAGDVLFGKLRPYLAKVYLAETAGLVSSEALVMRTQKELYSHFLKYFVLSKDFIDIVDSSTFGSKMPRANWEFIGNLPLALPPLSEQQSIAAFLDTETARIDAQRQAIEAALAKLQEYRSALISHAVTGKIDIRELSAAKEKP